MNERVLSIGKKWEVVVEIKRRCQNATAEDMSNLKLLVDAFNSYMGEHVSNYRYIRKISACSIPSICGQVAGFLKVQGLIDNVFSQKLKNNRVYKI